MLIFLVVLAVIVIALIVAMIVFKKRIKAFYGLTHFCCGISAYAK